MSLEASAIALTTAVVKAAAKIWLRDRPIAADAAAKVFDLLEKQVTGLNDQRKLRLLFTNLESRVADRLLPFLEVEFRALPDNERTATVNAARETFERAALTDDDLFATDLDAAYLYRYLLRTAPGASALLSADATALYRRVLRECCAYLVQVTSTLPRFQPGALVEILRRETEILETVRNVLAALPERRHPEDFAADFRRQVVTALDRMALFGAGLTDATRLYPLSVAYLSLSISADHDDGPADRIEHVLPRSSRILLRGEAGSGKTTLLQWLAVQCASRELQDVDGWSDVEPFLVRLRRFSRSPLPTPEHFLDEIGRHIADEMPSGWVQQRLRRGQAVLLVDGLDELPDERRREVREWLRELVGAFPRARFVVTTRPSAVAPGWLRGDGFTEVRLQPMTPRDVRTFVKRWHRAMPAVEDRGDALVDAIVARSALRRLAENPLMCALLCALHHEGNGRLPDNRMELYEVALRMLLDSRDIERRIEATVRLSLTEKLVLLRNLAYWLVRNGHTDVPAVDAEARIAAKLRSMGQIDVTPRTVFRHLLDRGGVLREPVPGRVDFVHRTFQEYLAAQAAVEEDDIGILTANAHLDEWREVVVLAAGHAHPAQRERLLDGILSWDAEEPQRLKLDLVALACLETSPELSERLRNEIEDRASTLIPPNSSDVADALAAAGEFVLDLLVGCEPEPAQVPFLIHAAALIGGPAALDLIARHRRSNDPRVVSELLAADAQFEPEEYAERVLADSPLFDGYLSLYDPAKLVIVPRLRHLERLRCRFTDGYGRLDFMRDLPRLDSLVVEDIAGYDLPSLSGTGLTHLTLTGPPLRESTDLSPLAEVRGLRSIEARVATHGWPALAELPELKHLQLSWIHDAAELADLVPLTGLRSLSLSHVFRLDDLTPLEFLAAPTSLAFLSCKALEDVSLLTRWAAGLRWLRLIACPPADPAPIAELTNLRLLDLTATDLPDLALLSGLRHLEDLRLRDLRGMPELTPLADLGRLKKLTVTGMGRLDLRPLAGRSQLRIHVSDLVEPVGVQLLGPDSTVVTIQDR
ncbi:NACHT domain-containing protein [Amycolatopsis balhimycina DSM 5908]|uniref:NACHT domain-containing protein n=1 Tax=Amycolatopsis balhimycina DSM 5908 TaxID=1081091 RepID=A0A428WJV5_AMYBA|nr:NACHT domain-containing protein [Amycolatopsis balhimycina]RSM43358.1 NACHT domain-containing protein [Amycolatopsis balhimycina DSM 5908]